MNLFGDSKGIAGVDVRARIARRKHIVRTCSLNFIRVCVSNEMCETRAGQVDSHFWLLPKTVQCHEARRRKLGSEVIAISSFEGRASQSECLDLYFLSLGSRLCLSFDVVNAISSVAL